MTSIRLRVAAVASALLLVAVAINAGAAERATAPPPTPVPPHGSPSPFPTSLATPHDTTVAPTIDAGAALLADPDTGQVLYAKDPRTRRPIASITKLMTALLVRADLPLHATVTVDPEAVFDRRAFGASSVLGLQAGERISVEDLLYAMLLGSANDAAVALAIADDGSEAAFVRHMNVQARRLGMTDTHFASASGLDDDGYSTPRDLLRLTRAVNEDETLRTITATRFRRIPAPKGPVMRDPEPQRVVVALPGIVRDQDRDHSRRRVLCGRVGASWRTPAGRDRPARRGGTVLGCRGAVELRVRRVAARHARHRGDPAGDAAIRGGTVPVVAASDLAALVPVHDADDRTQRVVVDPGAAFPPATDERVATLVVSSGDQVLGQVPLIVPVVPPPPQTAGPWWLRAGDAVAGAVADAVRAVAA